ncbi:MAG: Rrf2 family transcriptional regulator, partial [Gemmatimonadales bacterium]
VPRHYLGKVLRQLSYMGILNSSRGRCGGFRIAVPAEQISLLEIVSCFDGSTRPTCLLCWEKCDAGADCPVHDNCTAAAESAERFLNETTVADLIRRGRRDANGIGCEH